jgi:hypothetical protein
MRMARTSSPSRRAPSISPSSAKTDRSWRYSEGGDGAEPGEGQQWEPNGEPREDIAEDV